mmetsp:Transcript_13968/g.20692  ORF Transcript_13968/g.20692 Transcript_13968/m.20692 type:complete len:200 (-) Transcript_13968:66-665(-)
MLCLLLTSFLCLTRSFFIPSPPTNVKSSRIPLSMGIKAVENFDASFSLTEECLNTLTAYLTHPDMIKEVCKQYNVENAEFMEGEIFQPVPYSSNTPHGMPPNFEKYYLDEEYAIVNVPPVVMFKAKIFKPSRLCAVYHVEGRTEEQIQEIREKRNPSLKTEASSNESVNDVWDGIGEVFRENFNKVEEDDDDDLDSLVV